MFSKRMLFLVVALSVVIGVFVVACSDSDDTTIQPKPQQLSKYFVLNADTGWLLPPEVAQADSDSTNGTSGYVLTLENASDVVAWYADRPNRQSGQESMRDFVENVWPEIFSETSPNAVLGGYVGEETENDGFYFSLQDPAYDSVTDTLTFAAVKLYGWTTDEKPETSLALRQPKITILPNCESEWGPCWSFSQISPTANFVPSDDPGVYLLEMNFIWPSMYHFKAAPGEALETIDTGMMVDNWGVYFGTDIPNASLTGYTPEGKTSLVLLTLDNPTYDSEKQTFTYKATVLQGNVDDHPTLTGTTLLVDSAGEGSGYPDCPNWAHDVKFVNKGTETVTIVVTEGCYPGNPPDKPFNGSSRCWPSPLLDGKNVGDSFQLEAGEKNAKTLKVMSCWSGNFGTECSTCKTKIQTLVEFTFDGGIAPTAPYKKLAGLLDNYDMSFVNGFVRVLEIKPNTASVPKAAGAGCETSGCTGGQPVCTEKLTDGDACLSPCQYMVANDPTSTDRLKYCCICTAGSPDCPCNDDNVVSGGCCDGTYGCSPFSPPGSDHLDTTSCCPWYLPSLKPPFSLDNAPPNCSASTQERAWEQWGIDYIDAMHKACPGQYAWQYDDHATTTCQGDNKPMSYTISVY